jgi:hypothetical protein
MKVELMNGTPPISIMLATHLAGPGGHVLMMVSLLIASVKPTESDPLSLTSDDHYSHIRNIYAINTA